MRKALTEIPLLAGDDRLEQSERHVLANHGGSLEEALLLRWEPVDPAGQQRLHGRRDLDRLCFVNQTIGPTLAGKGPDLYQGADALLEEKRIALGPLDEEALEGSELGAVAHQGPEQFIRALRAQRLDPDLAVVALATPAVTVLRAIVDEEQHGSGGRAPPHVRQAGLRFPLAPGEGLPPP